MNLTRHQIESIISNWMLKFNNFDLPGVMEYIHDDIRFENWDGSVIISKKLLSRVWTLWFRNRNFNFKITDLYVDQKKQTAILEWQLQWLINNNNETRNGIDILFFCDDKIILKKTFSRTPINIQG